jgi:hypothetical protein
LCFSGYEYEVSTVGQVGDGNLLVASVTVAPVQAIDSYIQTQYAQFAGGAASILAASVGLGVNIDRWA